MFFKKKLYCFIHYGKHSLFNCNGYVMMYHDKNQEKFFMKVDLETFYQLFRNDKRFKIFIIGYKGDVDD